MKKIIIFALIMLYSLPVSAALYIDNANTGIQLTKINGGNYITKEDAAHLGFDLDSELIPIRTIADQKYIRWNKDNVYISTNKPQIERHIIGYSHQNRLLEALYITPPDYNKTILATFAMHGFEDLYANDGKILVETAEELIKHYSEQPELLHFTRLIIVPCVNPDGVYAGWTKDGFGRCNAIGIDINRDFDYNWGKINTSRFKTGDTPFSSSETQALRDLVLREYPDVVLDFHGWLDCVYGPPEIKSLFNLGYEKPPFSQYKPLQGYFMGWSSQYSKAALIEYRYASVDTLKTQAVNAINTITKERFDVQNLQDSVSRWETGSPYANIRI